VVSNFIMQALRGQDITIFGNGMQTRSFCFVSDLIPGLIKMMAQPPEIGGPVNLGNPGEFTMLELAQQIVELTNSNSKIVFRDLPPDDPKQRRPDISQAEKLLRWRPAVPLRDGLQKTIEYFAAQEL